MSNLIAALATPAYPAAIGILRLSGEGAIAAVQAVFRPQNGRPMDPADSRRLVYGTLLDKTGQAIDQVLATLFPGPYSYTGEDSAELQCHGSPAVLALGLEALYAAGARPARPGEFTQRAFLNGKLDLTQAEAVADLLDAESDAAVHHAAGQLTGSLSRRVGEIYDLLLDLMAHFHAVLDYPDEDIDPFRAADLDARLAQAEAQLAALLAGYDRGRALVRGVPCVLLGRANAGKSSLLNALLGYERAIVTPIAGTTRDTVEERVRLGGVLLRLIDTAGLRETEDEIERLGVARSRAAAETAQLAIAVLDGTGPGDDADRAVLALAEKAPHCIVVLNKSDLPSGGAAQLRFAPEVPVVSLSALTGAGLEALAAAVARLYPRVGSEEAGSLLTNARQAEAAGRALEAVRAARAGLADGMTPDAVLTDAEGALAALGELTGKVVRDDIVSRIFTRFCVGK